MKYILGNGNGSLRVLEDISRAGDWIDMIASRVKDEYDFSITQPKYAEQELDKCDNEVAKIQYMDNVRKKAKKDFDAHVERKKPVRTILFDTKKLLMVEKEKIYTEYPKSMHHKIASEV